MTAPQAGPLRAPRSSALLRTGVPADRSGGGLTCLGSPASDSCAMARNVGRPDEGTGTSGHGIATALRPAEVVRGQPRKGSRRPVRTFDTATSACGSGPLRGAWSAWSRTWEEGRGPRRGRGNCRLAMWTSVPSCGQTSSALPRLARTDSLRGAPLARLISRPFRSRISVVGVRVMPSRRTSSR